MSGELLCIIPGPSVELARSDIGEQWCFGCRERLPHVAICFADEDVLSYYEPIWVRRCSRCGKDRTEFPS